MSLLDIALKINKLDGSFLANFPIHWIIGRSDSLKKMRFDNVRSFEFNKHLGSG